MAYFFICYACLKLMLGREKEQKVFGLRAGVLSIWEVFRSNN